ncbi:MAG TPA: hypothetical protein VHD90_04555, partial [Phototrophicaceae bacterium]|nr:hypothetical protein [Phototrophicaceae bacterium]
LFFVGDSNPLLNLPGRPLIDLVSGVIMIIGVIVTLRWWRQARCALLLIALVFIVPTALHAPSSPNFLAYAPLLPLIALFFGVGVSTLYHSLPRGSRRIAALGLIALLAFNLVWVTRDFFTNWVALPDMQSAYNVRLGELAHYIDLTAGQTPTVICTSDLKAPTNPIILTNTQLLALMMNRQDAVLRYADCGSALILTDGGNLEQVILSDPTGINAVNPTLQTWLAQGTMLSQANLPPQSVIRLQVADALANHIGSFMTTAPIRFDPQAGGDQQVAAPPLTFGGNLTFLGYEHSWAPTYSPGDVVPVTTYWRVDGVVPSDLRLFTHILADPTSIAAQNDPISVLAETLRPRDIFIQVTYVMLPRTMPLGKYSISVGAYRDTTPQMRLPVLVNGQPHGTRLFLGQITVQGK